MVKRKMECRAGQIDKRLIERFQSRDAARVLIVGSGIDARRDSKWIDNDRNIGVGCSTYIRTDCTIVEIQCVGENVRLSSVIGVKVKDQIAHRLVAVIEPRGGGKCGLVKKPRVDDPVNLCLVNSAIVETVEIRNCPRTGARGCRGSRCSLINVAIPDRANKDLWIELPVP